MMQTPPLNAFPHHRTERLNIRPLDIEDAEALQALTDDPAITESIHFLPSPFTFNDARDLIGSNDAGSCFLGVWGGDRLIGVVGAHIHGEQIEIGYWIGAAFQGRRYATEAVSGVIAHLRRIYPAQQIIAECRRENRTSWGLLHKLGFRPTGEHGRRPGRELLSLPDPVD